MVSLSVDIKGSEKVLTALKKVSNPSRLLDQAIRETATNSYRDLRRESLSKQPSSKSFNFQGRTIVAKNLKTGLTANSWITTKLGPSKYRNSNNRKTQDGKHLIVDILDQGTKRDIRPKNKKALYMPLTRRGQAKAPGAVDKSLKYGEDFILLKRAKKREGTRFIEKNVSNSSKDLTRRVIQAIRRVYI